MVPLFSAVVTKCDRGWQPHVNVHSTSPELHKLVGQVCINTTWPTAEAAMEVSHKIIAELVNTNIFTHEYVRLHR